jgi:hypothetical protein
VSFWGWKGNSLKFLNTRQTGFIGNWLKLTKGGFSQLLGQSPNYCFKKCMFKFDTMPQMAGSQGWVLYLGKGRCRRRVQLLSTHTVTPSCDITVQSGQCSLFARSTAGNREHRRRPGVPCKMNSRRWMPHFLPFAILYRATQSMTLEYWQ